MFGKRAIDPALKEKAKTLWELGQRPPEISKVTGVKPGTIHMWATRGNWEISLPQPSNAVRGVRVVQAVQVSDAPKPLANASGEARAKLSGVLATTIRQLERLRFTGSSLRNSGGKQGYAAVLKSVVETAEIVYGWRQDDKPGVLFLAGRLPEPPDPVAVAKPITEIGANLPPPPEPENVAIVQSNDQNPTVPEPPTTTPSV